MEITSKFQRIVDSKICGNTKYNTWCTCQCHLLVYKGQNQFFKFWHGLKN